MYSRAGPIVAGMRQAFARIHGIAFQKRGVPISVCAKRSRAISANNQWHNRNQSRRIGLDACAATTNRAEIGFQLPLLGNEF
jgi:hypothetical protein